MAMQSIQRIGDRSVIVWGALLTLILLVSSASAQPVLSANDGPDASRIDKRADMLLKEMSDFLAGLNQYSVAIDAGLESVLSSGQKLLTHGQGSITARPPNRFRSAAKSDVSNLELFYDGSRLTIYDHQKDYYAFVDAPPTIDEVIAFSENELSVDIPGSDLLLSNTYEALTFMPTSSSTVKPRIGRTAALA